MRYFWTILILFCVLTASAVDRITATVTISNTAGTTNGQTFVVNGNTRMFTNAVFNATTQVLTNSTHLGSKTNLFNAISSVPFNSVTLLNLGTNQFSLIGSAGTAMTVTPSAGYATVSYSTQTVSSMTGVRVPISGEPTGGAQTSIASLLSLGIWTYSTNPISQSSILASNLVGTTNAQTITGAKQFTSTSGAWYGYVSNATGISGIASAITNGNFKTNIFEYPTLTNAQMYGTSHLKGSIDVSDGFYIADITFAQTSGLLCVTNTTSDGILRFGSGKFELFDSTYYYGDGRGITNHNHFVSGSSFASTNIFPAGSDISFGRYALSSLANGNNAGIVVGTNVFVEVSGPSAAFAICGIAGGRDGKLIYIVNQTGFDMTISHQSGVDATAANRIINMTGADRATTGNGTATLIYSASASRWLLINFDP